jgi:hypothetical protein
MQAATGSNLPWGPTCHVDLANGLPPVARRGPCRRFTAPWDALRDALEPLLHDEFTGGGAFTEPPELAPVTYITTAMQLRQKWLYRAMMNPRMQYGA